MPRVNFFRARLGVGHTRRGGHRRVLRMFSSLAIAIPVVTVAMVSASAAPGTNPSNASTAKSELEMDISGNGSTFVEGEPEIAVSPTNPDNLLIDWTTFTYNPFFSPAGKTATEAAVSNNGGLSWQRVDLGVNGGPHGSGDAVAAAGRMGPCMRGAEPRRRLPRLAPSAASPSTVRTW